MSLSLSEVLSHPSLQPVRPEIVAGGTDAALPVRWIHSSEVLEIAPLLHGGELLLTGGEVLAHASVAERRRYIRELSAHHITAVGIETGTHLDSVPDDIVDEADRCGFCVIALRGVVPFVDVAEAINGALVNGSVTRYRFGAELTEALLAVVANGGGTQPVLDELARRTATAVTLFDGAGEMIARAATSEAARLQADTGPSPVTSPVTVRGMHTATVAVHTDDGTDPERLQLIADRGADVLGLALLRTHPPSPGDVAASELVRLAATDDPSATRLEYLSRMSRIAPDEPVVGVVGLSEADSMGLARLHRRLQRHGTTAMDRPAPAQMHVLVSLGGGRGAGRDRADLVEDLRAWAREDRQVAVVVGPAAPRLDGAPLSLGAAIEVAAEALADGRGVVDAGHLVVERLLADDRGAGRLSRIAREQLAVFDVLRSGDRDRLLTTLETYFDAGCNKTLTASRLHVERQTLYARLRRAFAVLGGDPTGTPEALSLHLALRARAVGVEQDRTGPYRPALSLPTGPREDGGMRTGEASEVSP